MRKYYQKILNEVFYKYLTRERTRMNLTQEKMADILEISQRNFVNLDNGKNCCGTLTLTLFLIYCTNPIEFLNELKLEYENRAVREYSQEVISYRQRLPVRELWSYEPDSGVYTLCAECQKTAGDAYARYCTGCGRLIFRSDRENVPVKRSCGV